MQSNNNLNTIDKFFKENLDGIMVDPPANVWENISNGLDNSAVHNTQFENNGSHAFKAAEVAINPHKISKLVSLGNWGIYLTASTLLIGSLAIWGYSALKRTNQDKVLSKNESNISIKNIIPVSIAGTNQAKKIEHSGSRVQVSRGNPQNVLSKNTIDPNKETMVKDPMIKVVEMIESNKGLVNENQTKKDSTQNQDFFDRNLEDNKSEMKTIFKPKK